MKINTRKTLAMTPWDLVSALRTAGLVDADCCEAEVSLVSRTEVNEGRTVVVSWSLPEKNVAEPEAEMRIKFALGGSRPQLQRESA